MKPPLFLALFILATAAVIFGLLVLVFGSNLVFPT